MQKANQIWLGSKNIRPRKFASGVGGKAMPDRYHWFGKKEAPYAGREPKPKPRVLNEDLLNLPLVPDQAVDPEEELSEEAKGFLHRLFNGGKSP